MLAPFLLYILSPIFLGQGDWSAAPGATYHSAAFSN